MPLPDEVAGDKRGTEMSGHRTHLMSPREPVEAFGKIVKVDHDRDFNGNASLRAKNSGAES